MSRFTASQARRHFSELLDAAERGEEVVIERRGTRFRVTLSPLERSCAPADPLLVVEDPEVLSGEWSWKADEAGQLTFAARDE